MSSARAPGGRAPRHSLARAERGSAAAEMALVFPLLVMLTFLTLEGGNYVLDAHAVEKGVRDASRYAARVPLETLVNTADCSLNSSSGAVARIQRVARTGWPETSYNDGTTPSPRLGYWTDDTTVTVSVSCDSAGSFGGVYTDFPVDPPRVTVSANVGYFTLFPFGSWLNPLDRSLRLNASDQSGVFGA